MFSLSNTSSFHVAQPSNTTSTYAFLSMTIEALGYWINGVNPRFNAQIQTLIRQTKRSTKNNWEVGKHLRHLIGSEGEEFQVNTYTFGNQDNPAIAKIADGGFVVAWQSADQDSSGYEIYARRYTSSGESYGPEFRVNTYTANDQWYPAIAALTDGGFVIAWQSYKQDDSMSYGIYAQRYTSSSAMYGSEFRVNTYTASHQEYPAITGLSNGGFVITWQSLYQDDWGYGIYAQSYTSSSTAYGVEFQVNTYTGDDEMNPAIAELIGGDFVIVWQTYQNGDNGIYAQRYTSFNEPYGLEFRISTHKSNYQELPAIVGLSDGGFVVTWQSAYDDGSGYAIYAQRYTSFDEIYGSAFQVNTYTTKDQKSPAIAALSDGGFVITWNSNEQDGSWAGVYAQRYTLASIAYGSEFQVNTYTTNDQLFPAIIGLSDESFVIIWESDYQDGSEHGIYGKQFNAERYVYKAPQSSIELSKSGSNSNILFIIVAIALPVSVLALVGCVFYFKEKKTANLSHTSATFYFQPLLAKSSQQQGKFLEASQHCSF